MTFWSSWTKSRCSSMEGESKSSPLTSLSILLAIRHMFHDEESLLMREVNLLLTHRLSLNMSLCLILHHHLPIHQRWRGLLVWIYFLSFVPFSSCTWSSQPSWVDGDAHPWGRLCTPTSLFSSSSCSFYWLTWVAWDSFFFHHLRSIGLHPLLPSSLELPLITIFFNIFACLLARALYIVKKVKLLGWCCCKDHGRSPLLRTRIGVKVLSSFS